MREALCGFNDVPGQSSGSENLVLYGPTLLVNIGFDEHYSPAKGGIPVAAIKGISALVDTGATESCIDSVLAAQLNLPIVDRRMISGVHGCLEINIHLAQIHVPQLNFTVYGAFAGVHLAAGGQMHSALIGRTFLRTCRMEYDGITGTVKLSIP